MTIVSERNAEIRARITRDLGRGVTVFKGYGGMSGAELAWLSQAISHQPLAISH
jgi:uncharacterized membrane-anchored protein YitT (DUF2179 family)